jgi:hypothetical protein
MQFKNRDWTVEIGSWRFGLIELETTPPGSSSFTQTIICSGPSSIAVLASTPAVATCFGCLTLVGALLFALLTRYLSMALADSRSQG